MMDVLPNLRLTGAQIQNSKNVLLGSREGKWVHKSTDPKFNCTTEVFLLEFKKL